MEEKQKLIPTQEQQQVLSQINDFLASDNDIFILHGYAGTGKTTMIKWICEDLSKKGNSSSETSANDKNKPFYVLTPTGRAARVLKSKGIDACTVHSLIYSRELICLETNNKDYSKKKCEYIFPLEEIPECTRVLIVDESSMIGDIVSHTEFLKFGSGRLLSDLLIYRSMALNNFIPKSLLLNSKDDESMLNDAIKQFCDSNKSDNCCKIIFVGDDAQLPPIGENFSRAMSASHLTSLGLKVEEAFLTNVLRQKEQSGILKASIDIRTLLKTSKRTSLRIEDNGDDITEIPSSEIIGKYISMYPQPAVGSSVIVCHSNKQCYQYNMAIRENYFSTILKTQSYEGLSDALIPLQVGDILLNNKNSYTENNGRVFNGDMCVVTEVGEEVTHKHIPVTINNDKRHIDLHFRKVKLLFPDYGLEFSTFVIENLLFSKERSLSVWETRALYIDFCIRVKKSHPIIKEGTKEFKQLLQNDQYMNALQTKFGYAITCHKAQGGEWKSVFVDYIGQCGLSDFQLKWCYTATTRAKEYLYVINPPKINGLSKLSFSEITHISNSPKNFFATSIIIPENETPYHSADAPIGTKLKFYCCPVKLKTANESSPKPSKCGLRAFI